MGVVVDAGTEWVMCGRKKSFRTKSLALRVVSHMTDVVNLRVYECPICCLWHLTKTAEKIIRCQCGKRIDPFLPMEPCKQCAVAVQKKAMEAIRQLMLLFRVLHEVCQSSSLPAPRPAQQKKKTVEEKNLEGFSRSINTAAVYLMKHRQEKAENEG